MTLLTVPIGRGIAQKLSTTKPVTLVPSGIPKKESLVVHRNGHNDFRIPSVSSFLVEHGYFTDEFRDFVDGHPLKNIILRPLHELTSTTELQSILDHVEFELGCYPSGAIPASTRPESTYSKFAWTRDMANKTLAMIETGDFINAKKVVYRLAEFYNAKEQRDKLVSYHWHPHGDPAEPALRYQNGNGGHPPIRAAIDGNGQMVPSNHPWAHNQFDAIGAWLYTTFYLADILGNPSHPQHDPNFYEPNFLKNLDHHLSFGDGQNRDNTVDSIFSVALKTLNRVRVWDNYDVGPWEDIRARKRASSIGICLAAAKIAKTHLEHNNWSNLNIYNREDFKVELQNLMHQCGIAIQQRIPGDGRDPTECDVFPSDSALTFLLYPYNPGLTNEQEMSILKSLYTDRMGAIGFTRRNDDEYLGMDYHSNLQSQGIYANRFVPNFKAAEWTLFDPYLATYYTNKVLEQLLKHGTIDRDRLELAEFHLRRSIAHITKEDDKYIKRFYVASGETLKKELVKTNGKRLPEAFFFDSFANNGEGKWRANENTPLLWTEANFLIMLRKQLELKAMLEELFPDIHSMNS